MTGLYSMNVLQVLFVTRFCSEIHWVKFSFMTTLSYIVDNSGQIIKEFKRAKK